MMVLRSLWPVALACAWLTMSRAAWGQSQVEKPILPRLLTLEAALETALNRQPQLRQARAELAGTEAQAAQTGAARWPQISLGTSYQLGPTRQNVNQVGVPITNVGNYALSVNADQLIYDFDQTQNRYRAGQAQIRAQESNAALTAQQVRLAVRLGYFVLQAKQSLLKVAEETLANQKRHQGRISNLVAVGLRAPIDRAQAARDVANAQLQLINAQNEVRTAKAQLDQAMGLEEDTAYRLADEGMPPVAGEAASLETLLGEALQNRPDITALRSRIEAQKFLVSAAEHNNHPSIRASAGAGANGTPISDPFYNWGLGLGLSWPLYTGGAREAQAAQARATLASLQAQLDNNRQQMRLTLEQTRLRVTAGQAALKAAEASAQAARQQLNLAEGRYAAGVGSVLELGDAQLSLTQAQAQVVQERFNLASARAQMLQALGRQ